MNNNKMKTCLEILYNCPFILLVIVTTCLAFLFSQAGKTLESDKNRSVLNVGKFDSPAVDGRETAENTDEIAIKIDENNDLSIPAAEMEPSVQKEEPGENEGTCKLENSDIKNEEAQNNDTKKPKAAYKRQIEKEPATKFEEYTPIAVNSIYYSDAGKVALTTDYDYVLENDSYFNDAVFLGDSRTLGISDYAGFDGADFFCDNGMTIYKLLEDKGVTYQKTGVKMDIKKVLQEKAYGKIYIMLGMNELGYGDTRMYMKQYLRVLRQIREWQPEAVIYIMANLHVSREKNNMESEFNNVNINDKNAASARLANGRDIFYLDCNPLFTDEEGYLQAELTFDGVHLYAQHYDKWREFLLAHGVEREKAEETGTAGEEEAAGNDGAETAADAEEE